MNKPSMKEFQEAVELLEDLSAALAQADTFEDHSAIQAMLLDARADLYFMYNRLAGKL